jgi:moderate conductance mechanosensitive channel
MKLSRAILLPFVALVCLAAAPDPTPPAAPPVTPAEAQQALAVLQDTAQRTKLIDVLRTIATATPAPPEKTPAQEGLADKTIHALSNSAAELSQQVASAATAAARTPGLWGWITSTLHDPQGRADLLDATWRLFAVLGCGLIAEWLLGRLLARPLKALATHPMAVAHEGPVPNHRRRAHALLQRLPAALAHFVLELLKPALFAIVANLALQVIVGSSGTRDIILTIVNAYVICRAVMVFVRLLIAPQWPGLRLLALSDAEAAYGHRWLRRLASVAIFGPAFEQTLLRLGLEEAAGLALLKLFGLVVALFLAVMTVECRAAVAVRIRGHQTGMVGLLRKRLAASWSYVVLALILALWVVWAFQVQDGLVRLARLFIGTAVVLIAMRLIAILLLGGVDHGTRVPPRLAARYPGLELRVRRYQPLLRQIVTAIVLVAGLVLLLEVWGLDLLTWLDANHIGAPLFSALSTILLLVVLATLAWEGLNILMERRMALLTREAHLVQAARLRTLLPILRTSLLVVILAVVGLTALSELGINIAPLLAGASIFGVALGFGSQKLVQDFITGLFLLLENTMQVGDWVTVGGVSGTVETLSIRTIRLRAGDGSLHIIPFSSVTTVNNVNRGIGNAAIGVTIAYAEDSDHVCTLLKGVGDDMRADPLFAPMIRSDVAIWGVDKVDASGITISGQIECTDSGRWGVQREFNRRMKQCLQENGISLGMPIQTIMTERAGPHPVKPPTPAEETPTTRIESPPPAALGNTA